MLARSLIRFFLRRPEQRYDVATVCTVLGLEYQETYDACVALDSGNILKMERLGEGNRVWMSNDAVTQAAHTLERFTAH